MATDLAEVIGSGIALHLLFGWPLLFSILVTILDVFLLLGLMHLGFRKIEAIVSTLILTILGIFIYLVVLSKPDIGGIFAGFLPQKEIVGIGLPKGSQALTLALGIIGATSCLIISIYILPFHKHERSIMRILQMFVGLCVS